MLLVSPVGSVLTDPGPLIMCREAPVVLNCTGGVSHEWMHDIIMSRGVPYSSKFLRSVIFMRCKLITKILFTKMFSPMGMSIGAAMNHENCCLKKLCRLNF